MTTIDIARASVADAEVLAHLHATSFADAWPTEAFAALIDREESFALIARARQDAEPLGLIVVRAAAGEAEILTFCVVPRMRSHGLGAALLSRARTLAYDQGAREMFLEVAEDNAAARALYHNQGFAPVGRRAGYYKQGAASADALVMRLVLD